MSRSSSSATGGIGFFCALGILFIGLKLAGVIDWEWWIVLLPIYGPIAAIIVVIFTIWLFARK